jgi:3,4-dihydroxy 2-butanone 4-phosphate synthase/GTP cyclohydrolase II
MFTGIIRFLLSYRLNGSWLRLFDVPLQLITDARVGDSISINGVCLTIKEIGTSTFLFFVMQETLDKTNLNTDGELHLSNVEVAMKYNERVDGHFVTGHVDSTATIDKITPLEDGSTTIILRYTEPGKEADYTPILKDSIALDGISLTLSYVSLKKGLLGVSILPLTKEITTISKWQVETKVNIEFNNKGQGMNKKEIDVTSALSFDELCMKEALTLSEKAIQTAPTNPWVGAVIVRDGKIIGRGYHLQAGKPHAEVEAIQNANKNGHSNFEGATIYVTLEPCFPSQSKTKRQPPCCTALISHKFKRVVIGVLDPDPRTAGKSVAALIEAGIEVDVGVLQDHIKYSLRGYVFSRQHNRPYGILKIALSANGCYASSTKEQIWITPHEARQHGRYMMRSSQAVVEGTGTAFYDQDALNRRVQDKTAEFPRHTIYLDRRGRLPPMVTSKGENVEELGKNPELEEEEEEEKEKEKEEEVGGVKDTNTIIYTSLLPEEYRNRYKGNSSPMIKQIPTDNHQGLDLHSLMSSLHSEGVFSVVFEGGGLLQASLLDAGLISEVWIYRGEKILRGGVDWFSTVNLGGYSLVSMPVPPEYQPFKSKDPYTFSSYILTPSENTDKVQQALSDLREGRPVILMDSTDRENEADLIMAAEKMTPRISELYRRYGTGVICATMTEMRAMQLNLPVLTVNNEDKQQTNFTISCDSINVTTGVSAKDRAITLRELASSSTLRSDLTRPGHIFPLIAEYGDLKLRQGHTEGSVTLCQLANLKSVAAIVEMVNDNGEMMRYDDCLTFMEEISAHSDAPRTLITMEELKQYLVDRPMRHLRIVASTNLTIEKYGTWKLLCYNSGDEYAPHVVLLYGDIYDPLLSKGILTRVHSECFTGDVLRSQHCDCGPQLEMSLQKIYEDGKGLIIFPSRHEGRSIGLVSKIQAYRLQQHRGINTFESNLALDLPEDNRSYEEVVKILLDLNVTCINLLTENPDKKEALSDFIVSQTPLICTSNHHNENYLQAKRERYTENVSIESKDDTFIMSKIDTFNQTPVHITSEMKNMKIGIVTTYWHRQEVDSIIQQMTQFFIENGLSASQINVMRVPGCGDMTTTISDTILSRYGLLIFVGFILKGETDHAKYTSEKVTSGIPKLSRRISRPVIDGVFHCHNDEQIQNKVNSGAAVSLAVSTLLVMADHC